MKDKNFDRLIWTIVIVVALSIFLLSVYYSNQISKDYEELNKLYAEELGRCAKIEGCEKYECMRLASFSIHWKNYYSTLENNCLLREVVEANK